MTEAVPPVREAEAAERVPTRVDYVGGYKDAVAYGTREEGVQIRCGMRVSELG